MGKRSGLMVGKGTVGVDAWGVGVPPQLINNIADNTSVIQIPAQVKHWYTRFSLLEVCLISFDNNFRDDLLLPITR